MIPIVPFSFTGKNDWFLFMFFSMSYVFKISVLKCLPNLRGCHQDRMDHRYFGIFPIVNKSSVF